jgi:hypothetical protein
MATTYDAPPIVAAAPTAVGVTTPRFSWGAVFAGVFVAIGIWLLLYTLGLGIGLVAIDPDNPSSLRGAGIGTGIWSLISPLIALFVGGLVAGRVAGIFDRGAGAIHGAVLWSVALLAGVTLTLFTVRFIVGTTLKATGAVASAAANVAKGAAGPAGGGLSALGVSPDDLLGPVNERLRAAGKPEVTADQMRAALRDVAGSAVREGRLDRELVIAAVARNTALDRADAAEVAGTIEQRFNAQKSAISERASEALGQAQGTAMQAAESTGKGLLGVFFALLLGLVSSVLGATLGVARRHRAIAREPARAGYQPPPVTTAP